MKKIKASASRACSRFNKLVLVHESHEWGLYFLSYELKFLTFIVFCLLRHRWISVFIFGCRLHQLAKRLICLLVLNPRMSIEVRNIRKCTASATLHPSVIVNRLFRTILQQILSQVNVGYILLTDV